FSGADVINSNASDPNYLIDTQTLFGKLVAARTPNLLNNPANTGGMMTLADNRAAPIQAADRPFQGLTTGVVATSDPQYPAGLGLDNTALRGLPTNPGPKPDPTRPYYANQRWYAPPGMDSDHPFLKDEILNKFATQLTTRSN